MKPEDVTAELVEECLAKVRSHPEIGRGTCSMVDETMDDGEVREFLREKLGEYGIGPWYAVFKLVELDRAYWARGREIEAEVW